MLARFVTFRRGLEILALLAILLLAAYLRLAQVGTNPGWYSDEATHVDIAQHVLHGQVQYMAVSQSTMLFARPPLFHLLLAGWFSVFGVGIAALRALTACLGVLAVALVYGIGRRSGDGRLALLAALLLAIYPQAVLYNRMGFSYNLLAVLVLAALLGLAGYWETGRRGWLGLAALAFGLGNITDVAGFTLLPVLLLVLLARNWRDAFWALPLWLLPFGLYALAMLVRAPEAFVFDLRFTLFRLNTMTLVDQLVNVARNYTILISQDFWMLAGVVGLFWLRPTHLRYAALLLFWIPLVLMGRTVALYSLSAYYLIPLLPLVALGSAALLRYGLPLVMAITRDGLETVFAPWPDILRRWLVRFGTPVFLALVVVSPLAVTVGLDFDHVRDGFPTAIDPFLVNPQTAQQVAAYINTHARAEDVIIASPAVGWQFQAQTADFQMAVAATGKDTPHLPGNLPAERWAFDPRFTNAHFVVVDNLWRNWGVVHLPDVAAMLPTITTWPLVFEAGEIQVYENPQFK